MASSVSRFTINGFVDTRNTVWDNIETIATAASSWVTWDSNTGKWSLVINQAGSSTWSFTDSNILSTISVTQNPVENAYNYGEMKYPNKDVAGQFDTVEFGLTEVALNYDYLSSEVENRVSMTNPLINETVQAQLILATEIKQSRRDIIVEFTTDFSAIGLKAGDLIDITNTTLNWTNKTFRIVSIEERDGEAGDIVLGITGVDYDAQTYVYSGFTRLEKSPPPEIPPIKANTNIEANKATAYGDQIASALDTASGRNSITQEFDAGGGFQAGIPLFGTLASGFTANQMATTLGSGSGAGSASSFDWALLANVKSLIVVFQQPQATYDYTVDSATKSITAAVPCSASLYYSADGVSYTLKSTQYMEWSTYSTTFTFTDEPTGYWRLSIGSLNTYDLNAANNFVTIPAGITSGDFFVNGDGYAATVFVAAFLA